MGAIVSQQEAQEWYKIVTNWPDYWNNFQRNFQGLLAQSNYITSKHPELLPEYEKLVRDGSQMYNRLLAVNESVSSIKNAWGEFTGWLKGNMGLSGNLDAIPVVIGAASAATLIYSVALWLREASEHARKIELMKNLEAKGVSPSEAAKMAGDFGSKTTGTLFGIPVKWLLIGAGVLLVVPVILPMIKGKR